MERNSGIRPVRELMLGFEYRTGLVEDSESPPRRYLWTDAFALCNFLELFRRTNEEKYRQSALRLVGQVHRVLGRHRGDDPRSGWISGLDEEEGGKHPTRGGLRIGKEMNEREPGEALEDRLEWERDGQYFHYLTKWMHALNRLALAVGDPTCNRWAVELAKKVHAAFTYTPSSGGRRRMYWKMSIDLSRPLVTSMGQHDPLDGLITYHELQAAAGHFGETDAAHDLRAEISDMTDICGEGGWATDDPLGAGELLVDSYQVARLIRTGRTQLAGILPSLLDASRASLDAYIRSDPMKLSAEYRLPFRELGLSIGLSAVERLKTLTEADPSRVLEEGLDESIGALMPFMPLRASIEEFWTRPVARKAGTWTGHLDINEVMLATSLAPDGYLG